MKAKLHKCPVCKNRTITEKGKHEICDICNWEDDPVQRKDKNFAGGANKISLNTAIKAIKQQ